MASGALWASVCCPWLLGHAACRGSGHSVRPPEKNLMSEVLPESSLVLQLLAHTAEATVGPAELLQAPVLNRLLHLVSQLLHLHLQHLQLPLHHLKHRVLC